MKLKRDSVYNGDCMDLMKYLPNHSIDFILCDLPYGTTACAWDDIIPLVPMWEEFRRITKDNAAVALFASNPFTAKLIMSNTKEYRHQWVWYKASAGNFINAKYAPLKVCEDIVVFSKEKANYYPHMEERAFERKVGKPIIKQTDFHRGIKGGTFRASEEWNGSVQYPKNLVYFSAQAKECNNGSRLHPTQKPVDLCEYLIKTYTLQGELVLDITMGSGSTCVAAKNTGRRYIGFEKDQNFYSKAVLRLETPIQVNSSDGT